MSEKNFEKNKSVFCESGTALKSYGQFPDYLIASGTIPHVARRGFTQLCLYTNFFAKKMQLNLVKVELRFLDNFN